MRKQACFRLYGLDALEIDDFDLRVAAKVYDSSTGRWRSPEEARLLIATGDASETRFQRSVRGETREAALRLACVRLGLDYDALLAHADRRVLVDAIETARIKGRLRLLRETDIIAATHAPTNY